MSKQADRHAPGELNPSQIECLERGGICNERCTGALSPESTGLPYCGCFVKYYEPVSSALGINPKSRPRAVVYELETLVCTRCGDEYEIANFNASKSQYCPECRIAVHRESAAKWYAKNKTITVERTCLDCGIKYTSQKRPGPAPKYCPKCAHKRDLESMRRSKRRLRQAS